MTTPFPFQAGATLLASQLNSITELVINDKTDSYTLVAGDAGERVIMNKATSTTLTVPNSVFTAGQVVYIANKGAGTCTVTAGAGVTVNVSGSLALAQYGGGTLLALSASSFIFFPAGGVSAANFSDAATGTYSSGGVNYKYITYNSSGTLTVTTAGFADVLVVGGGGGGSNGGGGAGGHLLITDAYLPAGTATVTIGAGGAQANVGSTSRLGSYYGVGGGASRQFVAQVGGSGSGGNYTGSANNGAAGVGGQGNAGGNAPAGGGGAGGGGASAVGADSSGGNGGNGGNGTSTSLDNVATTRAGGGGGYASVAAGGSTGGTGGTGGGGNGGTTTGISGTANTGGGGGAGESTSGSGGSGVIIVRVKV